MATTATPWSGEQAHKLYLQSGQFTSTIKDSEDVSSLAPSLAIGICWDGTDTPWSSDYADKLFLQSGQFTSTLKTSQDINSIDTNILGISADGNNTPWSGSQAKKLYLTSGKFTSTIKDSEAVGAIDANPRDISYDGTNTPWNGLSDDKLYLQSAQFTSTLKTSQYIGGIDTTPTGISWDGTNTPWSGAQANKLYLQSGQFTSTLKESEDVSAVDNIVVGISTDDYINRTNLYQSITSNLSISDQVLLNIDYPVGVTPWAGSSTNKLYLQSGQFTSTIKKSEDVNSIDKLRDICWDGTDTPWCGDWDDRLYLQSGQFTSAIKDSEYVGGIDANPYGISADDNNTPWSGLGDEKLYLQSGKFTSVLKDSEYIGGISFDPSGISFDSNNTPWCGDGNEKLYLQLGQFTSTLITSKHIGGTDTQLSGISYDGINTPWSGSSTDKLYLQSGQFTSTIVTSYYVGGIDTNPSGISTGDYDGRVPDVYYENVSNNLGLNQWANSSFFLDCENVLNLIQEVNPTYTVDITTNITLIQNVHDLHIPSDFFPIQSTMNLQQTVTYDAGLSRSILQTMNLSQVLEWKGPHYFYINHYLTSLEQEASGILGCPWLPVEIDDDLSLIQRLNRTYEETSNHTINFVQEAWKRDIAESTINFTQLVSGGKSKGILPTDLSLVSTVNVQGDFTRIIQHSAIIGHALTYYVDKTCGDKDYTPFIGDNTIPSAPSPPPSTLPIIQSDSTITRFKLIYPGVGEPTDTIVLRAPELDNIDRYAFNRINRETRGGKLSIFADPNWPQVNTLAVNFIGLKKTEIDEVLIFLHNYVGEEIRITDWEGREWVGVIMTPNESATQDGKDNWAFTFEFEGVLVESYIPDNRMNLTDILSLEVHYGRSFVHTMNMIQSATYMVV